MNAIHAAVPRPYRLNDVRPPSSSCLRLLEALRLVVRCVVSEGIPVVRVSQVVLELHPALGLPVKLRNLLLIIPPPLRRPAGDAPRNRIRVPPCLNTHGLSHLLLEACKWTGESAPHSLAPAALARASLLHHAVPSNPLLLVKTFRLRLSFLPITPHLALQLLTALLAQIAKLAHHVLLAARPLSTLHTTRLLTNKYLVRCKRLITADAANAARMPALL
mmetsp:Transcript_17381/g.35854  ORF Transcript_17381/g.35854 Transcript_17381/m.35854 type:complete len:219 (-) Transcript_17381:2847-3503(-)